MNYLFVFLGGGLGSCARFGISRLFGKALLSYPIATSLANLLACLVLGYGLSLVSQGKLNEGQKLLLVTGFCGGFSTFSTFSAEVLELWLDGRPLMAALYVLLSVVTGVFAIFLLTK